MIKQAFEILAMFWRGLLALLGFTLEVGVEVSKVVEDVTTVLEKESAAMEKASAELLEETRKQRKAKQESKNV